MHEIESLRAKVADLERELQALRSGEMEANSFTKFPPRSLAWRVGGADSNGRVFPDFLISGHQVVCNLLALLKDIDKGPADFRRLLDFGCGCGRVTRFLAYERFAAQLVGCDIDPEAIAWCRENIPAVDFQVTPYTPPLSFSDDSFDFIYSISIFTHLHPEEQFAWLQELRRIASPGAILILSVQGHNRNWSRLPDEVKARLEHDGIWYDSDNLYFEQSHTYGFRFPETFKLTYHTVQYIQREWSKYFEILRIAERAVSYDQDAVVLVKR